MKNLKILFLICCCFDSMNLFAQTPKAIEADLVKSFKKINDWSTEKRGEGYDDSLWMIKNVVGEKLYSFCTKYPLTINYPFKLLKIQDVDISTSSDGLFRIYSWDTWTGGTMHFFESVFQYKVGNRTFAILDTEKREGDVRPNYNKLHTLRTSGKTYYLAVTLDIGSTRDIGGSIQIFDIENGKLNDSVKLIKTQSGLHSNLSYYYDISKSSGKLSPSGYPTVHYDALKKIIYIPLIEENNAATKNFIAYKFTGKYFEKVKP